ncbi:MAG TPA: hypothetical protein VMO17_09255 [Terriglobia bacterium]|nr:hypothetical protein [Terriglobia bacterium]
MCNVYLVVAYGLLWGIFAVYAWMLHGRQQHLEKEVEALKNAMGNQKA